jgi:hypothetical protein
MIHLFQNLIWPAVAGNVAWAFFSVAVGEPMACTVAARLTALFLVAGYLIADWLSMEKYLRDSRDKVNPLFWIADALLAASLATFAVATADKAQSKETWVDGSLLAIFVVAMGGHLFGAWRKEGATPRIRRHKQVALAIVNLLGVVAAGLGIWLWDDPCKWHRPVAVAIVVTLWGLTILCVFPWLEGRRPTVE